MLFVPPSCQDSTKWKWTLRNKPEEEEKHKEDKWEKGEK